MHLTGARCVREDEAAGTQPKVWGALLGGVSKNHPLSSALFARLPKPHHLVWSRSGLGPITTCLRPFWWLIFTFVRNGPFSRIFYTPPLLLERGFS